jgi:hypothetical protein
MFATVAVKVITVVKLLSCVTCTNLHGVTIQKAVIFRGILVYAKIQPSLLKPTYSHIMGCLHLFSCFSLFAKCTHFVTRVYCQHLLVLF